MENYQIQQEIKIDFATPDVPPRVYAKQYDNNMRIIKANLYANGQPYTAQSGFDVNVRMAKPDGTYVYNPALEISDTYVLIVLTQQMLAVAGECPAEIEVVQGGNVLSTATFVICVAKDTVPEDAIESTDEFKTIQELAAEVEATAKVVTDNLDAINAVSENIEAIKNAPQQAQNAANSATLAQSWAVGGTGTREGENTNNAQYWAEQAQSVAQGQLGWFETEQALQAAHPTGENGQWAIVGSTDTIWTWDSDTNAWVNSGNTTDLSNYYTIPQANATFATAAQGTKADTAVQSVNGKTGTAVTLAAADVGAAPASDGVSLYTCTTSGSTHALTGTGNNIKFVADSDFAEGDTIFVNGTAVTAQTQGGETLGDGAWVAGAVVMCYLEGSTLNFNEGAFGAVKPGQIIFASALNSMNVNTYTNYDSPYFLNGICKKSCNVHFFAAIGYQAQNEKAFTFSVTVNGEVKLSTNGPDGGAANINRDMGTLEINKGDVVSASFPIGAGGANQRGGAIIGVLN